MQILGRGVGITVQQQGESYDALRVAACACQIYAGIDCYGVYQDDWGLPSFAYSNSRFPLIFDKLKIKHKGIFLRTIFHEPEGELPSHQLIHHRKSGSARVD